MSGPVRAASPWPGEYPPKSILIIVTRRIGDVLLATPLIRSLKQAWPAAAIDALVFSGTEGILTANPDVRRVHAIPERPGLRRHLRLLMPLARRYDLALSLVPGDRPTFYAFVAGRRRGGLLIDRPKDWWKRLLLDRWLPFDGSNTHTVRMHLALADMLGVAARGDPVVAWAEKDSETIAQLLGSDPAPVAVLHPYPKFNYKMWSAESWIELAAWLVGRGYCVLLTGGTLADEVEYVSQLARRMPATVVNAAGRLTLGASACLVSRASVYVGPDTALTHVAAALGVPTIALFGPSDPVKWGPWPRRQRVDANPWRRYGSQSSGNVTLLQGAAPCAPCLNEGCGRNIASFSDCLQQLPASRVIAVITALADEREPIAADMHPLAQSTSAGA